MHLPIPDEDDQGHAVAELVRTGRGSRCVCAGELIQEPVVRRTEALLMLLPLGSVSVRPRECCIGDDEAESPI